MWLQSQVSGWEGRGADGHTELQLDIWKFSPVFVPFRSALGSRRGLERGEGRGRREKYMEKDRKVDSSGKTSKNVFQFFELR